MIQGILMVAIFFIMAALMIMKKMPTVLALTIMAVFYSLVSGEPVNGEYGLFTYVIPTGLNRLASTMMLVVMTCWLGKIMEHTGVTHTIVKKAAEFGGDKPFVTAFAVCIACCLLFTVLNGTGSVALVGSIALPILLSLGLSPVQAAGAYLCTYGIGSYFNPTWLAAYITLFNAGTSSELLIVACIVGGLGLIAMTAQLLIAFRRNGKKFAFAAPVESEEIAPTEVETLKGFRGLMACLTPVVVIILAFAVKMQTASVLFLGVIWICIFTYKGGWDKYISMVGQSIVEGWEMASATCSLMIGVGFVVIACGTPLVKDCIMPVVGGILPKTVPGLIIFACICAPLCLYRGFFNPWGMGAALAALLLVDPKFGGVAYVAWFLCPAYWNNAHDPASTQCIWSANFAGTDMLAEEKTQIWWCWAISIIAAIIVTPIYCNMYPL